MGEGMTFMLDCLRMDPGGIKKTKLQGLDEKNWEMLLKEASRHRIVPVIYQHIKLIIRDLNITGRLMTSMRDSYYRSTARNIRIYRQLSQVLSLLKNKGINVILLKGVHLAEIVYRDSGLRPMADIDLLARKDDITRIHQTLIEDSYIVQEQLSATKHLPPYRKENGVVLEIHFHIADPPLSERVKINELWKRAEKYTFQGLDVFTLCPEDLFLYLCLHGCIQHGLDNGLILCLDVAQIVKHYEEKLDWERLWKRGQEWGVDRSVYLMLALTEKILGFSVPEQISRKINPDQELYDALNTAEQLILEKRTGASFYLARLFGPQGWRKKLQYFKQRAFPHKEVMYCGGRQPEEGKRLELWLLYFSRVHLLLKKYSKRIWLGICKDPKTVKALDIENKKNALRDWLTCGGHSPDC